MAERSNKSDVIGQRTPRPKRDGKIQTDSATEETLDNDENIVSAPKAERSQDISVEIGQGANVDVENINEMAIRTAAPEGSPEISRTERSIDEEFGSSDAVVRDSSDKRKESRRKKKRRPLKKKTEYVHLGGGSLSEIAIRTVAPLKKNGDDISRTEITITFSDKGVERSAYSNEVAQRTPAPEGTSDVSRTERSIGKHFGSKRKRGRSSKKKKSSKRKKGSKKQNVRRKKRSSSTKNKESTEYCVCSNAIRTPPPEGSPGMSRTEKSIGFESSDEVGRSSVKKKKSKVRKSSKKRKVQRSKGVSRKLKEPTQYGGAAASEVAIRTEAPLGKGPLVSETERTINSACSVYSNELAIRTPAPEGSSAMSRTEISISESDDEGERSSVKKKQKVKKRSKKHKMRRSSSIKSKGVTLCGGGALSEVAIRTESPLGQGQPSATEKSIESAGSVYSNDVAIRTAAPEGSPAFSRTELSLSDVSGSSGGDLPMNKKEKTKGKSVSKKQRKRASIKKKSFRLGGSPSEVAIKTEAPLGKSPAVSRTEKTIESRPGSAFQNEVAIRTPVPDGSPDVSRTERSVGKPFHGDKRSSKKKKKSKGKKKRSSAGKGSSKKEKKKKSKKKRSSKSKKSSVKLDLRRSKRLSSKNKGIGTLSKSGIRTPSPLRKSEVLSGTQTLTATNLEQSSAAAKVEERNMPVETKHKDERQESPTDAETNKKLPKRGPRKSSRRKSSSQKRRISKSSKDTPPSSPPEKQPDSVLAKVEGQNESTGEKDKGVGSTEAEMKSTKSQSKREKAIPKQGDE